MYQVICLQEEFYTLATRRVFPTQEVADAYAATVATNRLPIVIEGLADEQTIEGANYALYLDPYLQGDML